MWNYWVMSNTLTTLKGSLPCLQTLMCMILAFFFVNSVYASWNMLNALMNYKSNSQSKSWTFSLANSISNKKAAVSKLKWMMTDCSCEVLHPLQHVPFNSRVSVVVERLIHTSEILGLIPDCSMNPRSTKPFIPSGSLNWLQLQLGV